MKVKIKAKLEIADHDGYCSGNDCEYSYSIKEYIVDIPIDDEWIKEYIDMSNIKDCGIDWYNYLPVPNIDTYGSYYCDLTDECEEHDLDKHSYRYTVLNVVVL